METNVPVSKTQTPQQDKGQQHESWAKSHNSNTDGPYIKEVQHRRIAHLEPIKPSKGTETSMTDTHEAKTMQTKP